MSRARQRATRSSGLQGKLALVTGGAGFIGANLVRRLLEAGAEVHLLVRPVTDLWRLHEVRRQIALHPVDLLDGEKVRDTAQMVRPQTVFHLAMPPGHPRAPVERSMLLQVAVLGAANLLEAALEVGVERFVHVGSSLEYGTRQRALREADLLRPHTFRGLAKAAASLLVQHYARAWRLPAVVLRPFSVYGPWEAPSRLVPTLLRAALFDREVALAGPGYRHDFVFVDDVVDACVMAAVVRLPPGELLNIGSGVQSSNEEVAHVVEEIVGRPLRLRLGAYPPSPPDTSCWVADIRKAARLLGVQPRYSLRAGLEATLEWVRQHGDRYGP